MKIILIGFMGSGKSTIAKALSQLLGIDFLEMDELVYKKTNTQNMQQVFEKGGEALLRETEIAIAKEYAMHRNLIISTGGGVVLNPTILDYLKKTGGLVVFLHTPFERIVKRLKGDQSRPLLQQKESAKTLYTRRMPLYFRYADEILSTGSQSPNKISLQIKKLLHQKGLLNGF
jgi:shikimate kinase